ncbi:fibrobacter succinogenes major paralogous domain-containing protein [Weeksellaceae bacterium TAE3-ERU29]|nr:fibrobacter succinogenes major paralogous domain-containing protein [Weeksellaceae bacterium TAE3-ERU29]
MKNLKLLLMGILAIIAIYSCGDSTETPAENQPPSKPKLTTPAQGAMEVETKPTFKWEESVDPEKEAVTYEIYVSKSENFSGDDIFKAIDIHQLSYAFNNIDLERATKYYWKVIAYDKKKNKSESEVQNFTTIDENLKITLLEPQNKATLDTNHTKIKWEVKRNSVYNKDVTYTVFLRNGSDEFSTPFKTDIKETEIELTNLKGNGKYYWTVKAMEGKEVVAESKIFMFTTPNTPPTPAEIKDMPKQTFTDDKVTVVFEWKASEDPDRISENGTLRDEKLIYDFYLSTNNTFTNDDIKASNLTQLTYTATGLDYKTDYWAKVVTKDESGGKAESKVFKITTKALPVTGNITIEEGTWEDKRDNKVYKTVKINGTTWLAENLAYIPYVQEQDSEGNMKICSVYEVENPSNKEELMASPNYSKYGVLYNVYTFKDIVPKGWHVATDEDWQKLEKLSGMEDGQINTTGYKNRGNTMNKFIALDQPYQAPGVKPTNEIKTSIKYGGYYKDASYNGGFKGEGAYTYIWTSTEKTSFRSKGNYQRAFSAKRTGIERNIDAQKYRMYVRLVKDND